MTSAARFHHDDALPTGASQVPEVTLLFWIVKIAATTLGETGGDAVSMSLNLGYLTATGIFACVFLGVAVMQIRATEFHAVRYWSTIVASTLVGTTLADFADRSLGIGYAGGAALLLLLLFASLGLWRRTMGTVAVHSVTSRRAEAFYWLTITCSQTLGTALGDWTADTAGLGYLGGAAILGGLLLVVTLLYFKSSVSRTALFWAAFILTRPLGAVVGDFLDKPTAAGGLALSRFAASAVLLFVIVMCLSASTQRAAKVAH